ncbi:hypothetical protein R1sor_021840 [Riccia sorocarpa]|uniref:Uncharacterized protein n=1 Tax=Riccia sorocarpa TaxID=122646 RepID=A0ABD3GKB4_9MARC
MAEREGAEIVKGDAALERAALLLEESGLPGGLLSLRKVIEAGHVKETGYVWITQEEETNHVFKQIGRQILSSFTFSNLVLRAGIHILWTICIIYSAFDSNLLLYGK